MDSTPGLNRLRNAGIAALALALVGVVGLGVFALGRLGSTPPTGTQSGSSAADRAQTVEAITEAARHYLSQSEPGKSEAILRAALERFPASQQVRFLLGETLLQLDRPGEAYEQYDQGILIGPDHPEYRHAAATIAASIGRLDEAEYHYMAAQRLDSSSPKYPLYLAQVYRKQGRDAEARASLVLATKLDPSLAIGWGTLASIAMDEGRLSVARGYVSRARALEPTRAEWRLIEARILRRENQPEEAATLLLAIPEPERAADAAVLAELAMCLGLMGRPEAAAEMYVKAVGASPEDPEMAYQAALWLDRAGERSRSATFASFAAARGHEGARKLVEATPE